MAHSHSHAEDRSTYYLDQVLTLAICALLAGVTIMLWYRDLLQYILQQTFHRYVLWGGITIIVVVVIRAVALVSEALARPNTLDNDSDHAGHEHHHSHEHEHAHEHHHDHNHADCAEHDHAHGDCADHDHHHEHDHDHEHTHAHAGHDHSHGLNPWRYIVLLLPIVLYFLGLPNAGLTVRGGSSTETEATRGQFVENTGLRILKEGAKNPVEVIGVASDSPAEKAGIKVHDIITEVRRTEGSDGKPPQKPDVVPTKDLSAEEAAKIIGGKPQTKVKLTVQTGDERAREVEIIRALDIINLEFKELERGSYSPQARQFYEGRTVRLKGQFSPGQDKRTFSLVRLKIQCCAADAIPLNVVIRLDPQAHGDLSQFKPQDWVEVTGRVEYLKRKDRDDYVAVLNVPSPRDVTTTQPDSPYIQ